MKYMLIAVVLATVSSNGLQAGVGAKIKESEDVKFDILLPSLHRLKDAAPSELKENIQAIINWVSQRSLFVTKQMLEDLKARLITLKELNLQISSKQQLTFDNSINEVIKTVEWWKSNLRWN